MSMDVFQQALSEWHFVVGFSGGKDSVASWLYLTRELGAKRVTCLFADVGHEFDETHAYLELLERDHGCPLVRIHATMRDMLGELVPAKICERLGLDPAGPWEDERLDMERLAILKRRFPSSTARFCTSLLKLSPRRRWLADHCDLGTTVSVTGVRAQESSARAKQKSFRFDAYMGCYLWLPIHAWTHEEVFALHHKHGVPPNPLYRMGMGRVGCAPCIMARKSELKAIALRKPETFDRLLEMEKRVAASAGKRSMSFFSNADAPGWHSERCEATGKTFPNADDVRRWSLTLPRADQVPMFEDDDTEDAIECSSQYGLCE